MLDLKKLSMLCLTNLTFLWYNATSFYIISKVKLFTNVIMIYYITKNRLWIKTVAIAVVCLFLFNDVASIAEYSALTGNSQSLSAASRFNPMGGMESLFRVEVNARSLTTLIADYLYNDISSHSAIEEINEAISIEKLLRIKKDDPLLAGFELEELVDVPGERAYRLPIYRNAIPALYYKFYLEKSNDRKPDIVLSLPSDRCVYIDIEEVPQENQEKIARIAAAIGSFGHGTSMVMELIDWMFMLEMVMKKSLIDVLDENDGLKPYSSQVNEFYYAVSAAKEKIFDICRHTDHAIRKRRLKGEDVLFWGEGLVESFDIIRKARGEFLALSGPLRKKLAPGQVAAAENLTRYLDNIYFCLDDRIMLINGRVANEVVCINDIIDNLPRQLSRFSDRQIRKHFVVESSDLPLEIIGNKLSLISLLCNLADNAAGRLEDDDLRVVVEARAEGDEAVITVSDNGPGIPAEDQGKVWQPFFTTGDTGIGLTETQLIVKDHGGRIELESKEGEGTRFIVRLPLRKDLKYKAALIKAKLNKLAMDPTTPLNIDIIAEVAEKVSRGRLVLSGEEVDILKKTVRGETVVIGRIDKNIASYCKLSFRQIVPDQCGVKRDLSGGKDSSKDTGEPAPTSSRGKRKPPLPGGALHEALGTLNEYREVNPGNEPFTAAEFRERRIKSKDRQPADDPELYSITTVREEIAAFETLGILERAGKRGNAVLYRETGRFARAPKGAREELEELLVSLFLDGRLDAFPTDGQLEEVKPEIDAILDLFENAAPEEGSETSVDGETFDTMERIVNAAYNTAVDGFYPIPKDSGYLRDAERALTWLLRVGRMFEEKFSGELKGYDQKSREDFPGILEATLAYTEKVLDVIRIWQKSGYEGLFDHPEEEYAEIALDFGKGYLWYPRQSGHFRLVETLYNSVSELLSIDQSRFPGRFTANLKIFCIFLEQISAELRFLSFVQNQLSDMWRKGKIPAGSYRRGIYMPFLRFAFRRYFSLWIKSPYVQVNSLARDIEDFDDGANLVEMFQLEEIARTEVEEELFEMKFELISAIQFNRKLITNIDEMNELDRMISPLVEMQETDVFRKHLRGAWEEVLKAIEERIKGDEKDAPREDKNLSRGAIDEIRETHPALEKAANEGRMFAITLAEAEKMKPTLSNETLADMFVRNLKNLNSQMRTKREISKRLGNRVFKERLLEGFRLMKEAAREVSFFPGGSTRLCIVVEEKDQPVIVFKDTDNNLIAHSGKGKKTGLGSASVYAGFNTIVKAVETGRENAFKELVAHEFRDLEREDHIDDAGEEALEFYNMVLGPVSGKDTTDVKSPNEFIPEFVRGLVEEDPDFLLLIESEHDMRKVVEALSKRVRLEISETHKTTAQVAYEYLGGYRTVEEYLKSCLEEHIERAKDSGAVLRKERGTKGESRCRVFSVSYGTLGRMRITERELDRDLREGFIAGIDEGYGAFSYRLNADKINRQSYADHLIEKRKAAIDEFKRKHPEDKEFVFLANGFKNKPMPSRREVSEGISEGLLVFEDDKVWVAGERFHISEYQESLADARNLADFRKNILPAVKYPEKAGNVDHDRVISSFGEMARLDADYNVVRRPFILSTDRPQAAKWLLERIPRVAESNLSLHIGFAGFLNLDIMAIRKSRLGLLLDINDNMIGMFNIVGEVLKDETVTRREEFVKKFIEKLGESGIYFSTVNDKVRQNQVMRIEAELNTPGSWLSDDEKFRHVQWMFRTGRVICFRADIRDVGKFREIGEWIRRNGVVPDTVQTSNIYRWVGRLYTGTDWAEDGPQENMERFAQSLAEIVGMQTFLVDAPGYSEGDARVQLAVRDGRINSVLMRRKSSHVPETTQASMPPRSDRPQARSGVTRRDFIKTSSAAVKAAAGLTHGSLSLSSGYIEEMASRHDVPAKMIEEVARMVLGTFFKGDSPKLLDPPHMLDTYDLSMWKDQGWDLDSRLLEFEAGRRGSIMDGRKEDQPYHQAVADAYIRKYAPNFPFIGRWIKRLEEEDPDEPLKVYPGIHRPMDWPDDVRKYIEEHGLDPGLLRNAFKGFWGPELEDLEMMKIDFSIGFRPVGEIRKQRVALADEFAGLSNEKQREILLDILRGHKSYLVRLVSAAKEKIPAAAELLKDAWAHLTRAEIPEEPKTPQKDISQEITEETERIQARRLEDTVKLIDRKWHVPGDETDKKRPLIIALGTDWIKGYGEGGEQYLALNRLMTSLRRVCREEGKDRDIKFIASEDKCLLQKIADERDIESNPYLIVLASRDTVTSKDFAGLRSDRENVFLAGASGELMPEGGGYVPLVEMLRLTLRLAFKKRAIENGPRISIVKDKEFPDIFILVPKAIPMDYTKFKPIYDVQVFA